MKVPLAVLKDESLSPAEKAVLSLIIQDSDRTHEKFPLEQGSFRTPDNMAIKLGLSCTTIKRALHDLEARGYLIRDGDDGEYGEKRLVPIRITDNQFLWFPDQIAIDRDMSVSEKIVISIVIQNDLNYHGPEGYYNDFKSSKIMKTYGINPKTLQRSLKALEENGQIDLIAGFRGKPIPVLKVKVAQFLLRENMQVKKIKAFINGDRRRILLELSESRIIQKGFRNALGTVKCPPESSKLSTSMCKKSTSTRLKSLFNNEMEAPIGNYIGNTVGQTSPIYISNNKEQVKNPKKENIKAKIIYITDPFLESKNNNLELEVLEAADGPKVKASDKLSSDFIELEESDAAN